MSKPAKNIFSASDIARYHSGTMPETERHLLEKAALSDPFLADAMEGYTYTGSSGNDLSLLREKLQEKTKQRKRPVVFMRSTLLMRAAAIFLVLAGAGWLAFQMLSTPENNLATVSGTPEVQDSVSALPFTDTDHSIAGSEEVQSFPEENKKKERRATSSSSRLVKKEAPPLEKKLAGVTAGLTRMAEENPDDSLPALKSMAGVEFKGDTLNVIMTETAADKPDVVLMKRKENRMVAIPLQQSEEPEPLQGWEHYNDYVINNIREPDELNFKPEAGEVVLSFDIDKNGLPVNIKVIKSTCTACEEEAVRLLKEGPKWKNRNKRKARITLNFSDHK